MVDSLNNDFDRYGSSNAVDGKHITVAEKWSCSISSRRKNPWWAVDLVKKYDVSDVVITTRNKNGKIIWVSIH